MKYTKLHQESSDIISIFYKRIKIFLSLITISIFSSSCAIELIGIEHTKNSMSKSTTARVKNENINKKYKKKLQNTFFKMQVSLNINGKSIQLNKSYSCANKQSHLLNNKRFIGKEINNDKYLLVISEISCNSLLYTKRNNNVVPHKLYAYIFDNVSSPEVIESNDLNNNNSKLTINNFNITTITKDEYFKSDYLYKTNKEKHIKSGYLYNALILKEADLSHEFQNKLKSNFFYIKTPTQLGQIEDLEWIYKYFEINNNRSNQAKILSHFGYSYDRGYTSGLSVNDNFPNIDWSNNNYKALYKSNNNYYISQHKNLTYYNKYNSNHFYNIELLSGNMVKKIRDYGYNLDSLIYDPIDNKLYNIITISYEGGS